MNREASTPHPPLQKRSHRTQQRLLDATERLLERQPFESITIAEIVREAGASVGAFYSRFPDKRAVLIALYERHDERLETERQETDWTAGSLGELAAKVCDHVVRYYRERRWFMRAICLHARSDPPELDDAVRARRASFHRRLVEPFLRFAAEIAHDDVAGAAEWGFFVVASVARDKILFDEAPHSASIVTDDEALVRELTRTLLGYLRSA